MTCHAYCQPWRGGGYSLHWHKDQWRRFVGEAGGERSGEPYRVEVTHGAYLDLVTTPNGRMYRSGTLPRRCDE